MRDFLPPLPPPRPLDPRPGDWETLCGQAARRMRRRYAAGGAVLSLALLATVLLSGAFRSPASLHIHEPTRPGPSSTPSGSPAQAHPAVAPGATGPAVGPAPGTGVGPGPDPVRTAATGSSSPSLSPRSSPTPPNGPGYTRTDVAYAGNTDDCTLYNYGATAWCFRWSGDNASARAGVAKDYLFDICNLSAGAASMSFPTTQEFSFLVSGDQREYWNWERGRRFTEPGPTVTLEAGRCARWAIRWAAVDEAGNPLPAGKYNLSFTSQARYVSEGAGVGSGWPLEVYE